MLRKVPSSRLAARPRSVKRLHSRQRGWPRPYYFPTTTRGRVIALNPDATIALGEPPPNGSERRESGRLAISIVDLVKHGDAVQLHALLTSVTIRELAFTLGALGALVCASLDALDALAIGQGLPVQASDLLRQWLEVIDHLPADDDASGPWRD